MDLSGSSEKKANMMKSFEDNDHPTDIAKEFFNKTNRSSDFEKEGDFLKLTGFLKNPPSEELKKKLREKLIKGESVERILALIACFSKK